MALTTRCSRCGGEIPLNGLTLPGGARLQHPDGTCPDQVAAGMAPQVPARWTATVELRRHPAPTTVTVDRTGQQVLAHRDDGTEWPEYVGCASGCGYLIGWEVVSNEITRHEGDTRVDDGPTGSGEAWHEECDGIGTEGVLMGRCAVDGMATTAAAAFEVLSPRLGAAWNTLAGTAAIMDVAEAPEAAIADETAFQDAAGAES